ncbi:spexin [Peromyscus leucopus]|uniref:spexin n=1 Tax=Peromyscus leucopus TaxID=10041 RepID=UPI0018850636|nr:spexin [Peromyscus leucopus]
MKGPSSLAVTALALLLALSVLGNSSGAPQRLFERRNWTPQAMLYLKGAQGRHFISDQSRRKELADQRLPPERRTPHLQLLTLPQAATLLLASLQKPREGEGENFDQNKFLEDRLLNW